MKNIIRTIARTLDLIVTIFGNLVHNFRTALPAPVRAWVDARGAALVLIFVSPFLWYPWTPFPLTQSLINPTRVQDAWTPIVLQKRSEAQKVAQEMKEYPQDVGNDFKPTRYANKRVVNPDVGSVAAEVPTTGVAAADDALVRAAQAFLGTVAGEGGEALFTPNTRAFGKYLFVTLAAQGRSEYTTIAVTKDGALDTSKLFGVGYDGVVVESVANTLVSRFPGLKSETAVDIAKKALANTSFRLAVNGLVVSVPTRALPKADTAVAYHEVLVPMSVVEQYLRK